MQGRITITVWILAVTATAAACAPDGEQASGDRAASGLPQLQEAAINRLVEEYPVLRDEPAPEPTPSEDADPTEIPARFSDRVPDRVLQSAAGEATFYADSFEGRRTASGIPFRQNQMVAAHRGFPFGTILRVTNLRNDRSVNVRVVDRGPFGSAAARGGVLDLSRRAAGELDFVDAGRAQVRVEVLEWGRGIAST